MTATNQARSHLTVAERAARGRAGRSVAPRSGHARFTAAEQRPHPVSVL